MLAEPSLSSLQAGYNRRTQLNTHSLDLLFLGMPKDALPGPALSHVSLKSWGRAEYKGVADVPLITPQCVSERELEYEIDRLHKELEVIRTAAKRKYAAYRRLERRRFNKKSSET